MLAEVLHTVLSLLKNDTGVQFVTFRIEHNFNVRKVAKIRNRYN